MLYVSTRNRAEVFTAHRALHEDLAPDGGRFVPFRLVTCSADELAQFKERSFGDTVAHILNLFFAVRLNGWDVDTCIGRSPVKLVALGRRTVVGEIWHNPDSAYAYIENSLYCKMTGIASATTDWARIAIRIAVLFGLFGELAKTGVTSFDIAVTAGDFSLPMAAWYARMMGLPIGMIICSCSENGSVWDLIHRGEYNTSTVKMKIPLPQLDVVHPVGLERLIFGTLGDNEVLKYLSVSQKGSVYHLSDAEALAKLNDKLYACVVGEKRVDAVISSVYRTNDYIMDPYTALSYGGLQDYRAKTGENRTTLLLQENGVFVHVQRVAKAIGVPEKNLTDRLKFPKE